ncbi:MAG TPA: metallophosphoesterase [Candidatus Acidoferrales bacterium]
MKVLIFSDTHGDLRSLERIVAQPADIYIAAGDLSNFSKGLNHCGEILKPLGERLWLLPGNHETHDQTRELCQKFGFTDFHRQLRKIGNTNWTGLGYSNITPFKTPGEYSETEIATALGAFDGISQLHLVVHFPPYDTKLDEYAPGQHAGSATLRAWVEREKPVALYCGHIHETAGMADTLASTPCVNVGKSGYVQEI